MINTSIDWSACTVKVEGVQVVTPCLEFVVFLDITDDAEILDFYRRGRAALNGLLTHYQAESMSKAARLNARADSMVETWFNKPRSGKTNYYMLMSDGDPDESATASSLELSIFRRPADEVTPEVRDRWKAKWGDKRSKVPHPGSLLRLTLPLDHSLAVPERAVGWILEFPVAKTGSIFTGHCGYALNHYTQAVLPGLYKPATRALASLVQRHPGLGWHGGGVQSRILRYELRIGDFVPLIKRANWVTLICDKTLGLIGGRPHVSAQLGNDLQISLHNLDHGLAIQAGATPEVGNLGQRDFLPLYRRVAAVLHPVRLLDLAGAGAEFMQAATTNWLDGLDKEYK